MAPTRRMGPTDSATSNALLCAAERVLRAAGDGGEVTLDASNSVT